MRMPGNHVKREGCMLLPCLDSMAVDQVLLWPLLQNPAHPASLLGRSAFADVILACNRRSGELVQLGRADPGHETVLVHFKIW